MTFKVGDRVRVTKSIYSPESYNMSDGVVVGLTVTMVSVMWRCCINDEDRELLMRPKEIELSALNLLTRVDG